MRILSLLILLIFSSFSINAQITLEEEPLESNPVLQRLHQQSQDAQELKLKRLFGNAPAANSRNLGIICDDDGIFASGDIVYVVSGDSVRVCLDTIGYATMTNLSVEGNFGTTSIDTNCIVYHSFPGIDLGLGDTIKVRLCLADGVNCVDRIFPVVVKRADRTYIEDATTLATEEEAILCADPANIDLPGGIFFSRLLECHDPLLASISNGNSQDSCLLLTAKRFAGADTVCVEIGNLYCICDSFKFPFRVIGDTLDLPFMDDFSYDGPYPKRQWLDINAFVNNKWSNQPPSVGFATMDGLDPSGTPYGKPYGRADFLTSAYLDLDGLNSTNNVYLSFYYEPKGLGYHPNDFQGDSLVLEFKNKLGNWDYVAAFNGIPDIDIDSVPPWQFQSYQITSDIYFYPGFQFRFVNYAARQGIIDVWHIDYVRLAANEIPDGFFDDIAFTQVPNSILKRYSNMPYRHFKENESNELITEIDIELFSQFPETTLAEPSDLKITELINDELIHYDPVLLEDPLTQRNVPSKIHKHHVNPIDIAPFPALTGDSLIFEMQYTFEVAAQNPGLYPQVGLNDTVRHKTYMTNYFSYDDGSAETAMRLGNDQYWGVAVEFNANIDDSLRAIQVHFPHYNDTQQSGAKFNILIFLETLSANSTPVYEKFSVEPFYADTRLDTLQGYTTYNLTDDFDNPVAVFIPAGKFYVALQQANLISTPVRIGLDKNTPQAKNYQFLYDNDKWYSLGNNGAAMVRAVVGDYFPGSTAAAELSNDQETITVYPNPSTGILNIENESGNYEDYQISVFNTMGQLIHRQNSASSTIDLSNQNDGIYFLKINNLKTKKSFVHKVFIFK